MRQFTNPKRKKPTDDIFDHISPGDVNDYLKQHMTGLSAKVFRTYNASITLQKELNKAFSGETLLQIGKLTENSDVAQKVYFYNQANKKVAELCNHKRSVSKNF